MAKFYGYNPPFIGGPQNIMSRQEDDQLIKNDILQLLFTIPGERVMRPDFGVNLRNAVFEQLDVETSVQLENEIVSGLLRYDKRLSDVDVSITMDDDSNKMHVVVVARLKDDPERYVTVEAFIGE